MHIPDCIIKIISSFNGTDKQLKTEKGLRIMFLKSNKFFTWGSASREESIHRFFQIYDIETHSKFVREHLSAAEHSHFYNEWATETQVADIISKVKV